MITVFTSTYNRAYILPVLFNSLQQQSNKKFEWIIVDDGSTDSTEELVLDFKEEASFEISYFKKNNEGKHIAINFAVDKARGDLFFIVDSDDFIANNTIEYLINKLELIKDDQKLAGIAIGYRSIKNNGEKIYSKELPQHEIYVSHNELVYKYGIKGDFATAFKTEIQRKYPYPYFEGENFFRESYVYRKIGKHYKTLYVDEPLYFADYLEDGLTYNSWGLLKRNPKGASLFFKELSKEDIPFKAKLFAVNSYWDVQTDKSNALSKILKLPIFISIIILINRKLKLFKVN